MTSWFVLFIVQARLVAHGHAGVHRRLGAFGALLALAVLVLGSMVAVTGARLGHSPPGAPPPLGFLAVPLGDMLVFALSSEEGRVGKEGVSSGKSVWSPGP